MSGERQAYKEQAKAVFVKPWHEERPVLKNTVQIILSLKTQIINFMLYYEFVVFCTQIY